MAFIRNTKSQSSLETQEALDLLLSILPNTHQLSELLDIEIERSEILFRNLVTNFQTATFILCEHLENLKSAGTVDNEAKVIHKIALCLEKIASPRHVPVDLQEVLVPQTGENKLEWCWYLDTDIEFVHEPPSSETSVAQQKDKEIFLRST